MWRRRWSGGLGCGFARHLTALGRAREAAGFDPIGFAAAEANLEADASKAVVLKAMPMNNATQITEAERKLLGDWFRAVGQGGVAGP